MIDADKEHIEEVARETAQAMKDSLTELIDKEKSKLQKEIDELMETMR